MTTSCEDLQTIVLVATPRLGYIMYGPLKVIDKRVEQVAQLVQKEITTYDFTQQESNSLSLITAIDYARVAKTLLYVRNVPTLEPYDSRSHILNKARLNSSLAMMLGADEANIPESLNKKSQLEEGAFKLLPELTSANAYQS